MKSRDFCYWLQGFFEIAASSKDENGQSYNKLISLNETQTSLVRKHLDLVFAHEIDPEADKISGKEKLDEIHGGTKLRC